MRYLSVCSGVEAVSVAWSPLGWKPVAFAEIDKFPSAVLAHHYPDVLNWGDITKFEEWPYATVDVLIGGTPCQSFSVAGLRRGLADPRGNLMLTYLAILDKYRPAWMVWENVPGVLSSNKGRDFGAFLGALGELGYGWAYRSLDAQYFHLAQRRERVFVVGCLGNWRRAAEVLFEPESLSGYPPPSREKGQAVALPLGTRVDRGGSHREAEGNNLIVVATHWAVRRLTPVECCRLQGFPDNYLDILYRGKPAADGPKYKALGNSMAVPVMRWIGERIAAVDAILRGRGVKGMR